MLLSVHSNLFVFMKTILQEQKPCSKKINKLRAKPGLLSCRTSEQSVKASYFLNNTDRTSEQSLDVIYIVLHVD